MVSLCLEFESNFGIGAGTEDRFRGSWSWGVVCFVLAKQCIEVEPLAHDLSWIIIDGRKIDIVLLVSAGIIDQDH